MTSLAVALSVDPRGPCALYIITDSRITWDSSDMRWDAGQKAFASRRTPDIFGYCGDAFFPPAILRQLVDQVDSGLLFASDLPAAGRHDAILAAFRNAMERRFGAPMHAFSLFHGARDGELMASRFRLWETRYNPTDGTWADAEHSIGTAQSYLVHLDGSGRATVRARSHDWAGSEAEGTSRAAIWSFCDALHSGKDPLSGGRHNSSGFGERAPARHLACCGMANAILLASRCAASRSGRPFLGSTTCLRDATVGREAGLSLPNAIESLHSRTGCPSNDR